MYFLRKTFDLVICLFGYWLGRKFGGWGGGVLIAFASLCTASWGWEWLVHNVFMRDAKGNARMNFVYGVMSSILVAAAAYVLWGK
jgi:fatty acid desaturase